MASQFYASLVSQAAATLVYNLSRLEYARRFETSAHVARWAFKVDSARKKFEAAQRACVVDAVGVSVTS